MDNYQAEIRTQEAVRYIAPLREGGSLPGLMEADDALITDRPSLL